MTDLVQDPSRPGAFPDVQRPSFARDLPPLHEAALLNAQDKSTAMLALADAGRRAGRFEMSDDEKRDLDAALRMRAHLPEISRHNVHARQRVVTAMASHATSALRGHQNDPAVKAAVRQTGEAFDCLDAARRGDPTKPLSEQPAMRRLQASAGRRTAIEMGRVMTEGGLTVLEKGDRAAAHDGTPFKDIRFDMVASRFEAPERAGKMVAGALATVTETMRAHAREKGLTGRALDNDPKLTEDAEFVRAWIDRSRRARDAGLGD